MSRVLELYEELFERYPDLTPVRMQIMEAYDVLRKSYEAGGKLLVAGNGGSAADSEHIVGELMKSFKKERHLSEEVMQQLLQADPVMGDELAKKLQGSLPAIALVDHVSLSTAYLNDVDPLLGFAQQVSGYGRKEDVFLAISTSGNSKNILYASVVAKSKGMKIIALTGGNGGKLASLADVCVLAPETDCYKIQEYHLPIYHTLCLMLEEYFF